MPTKGRKTSSTGQESLFIVSGTLSDVASCAFSRVDVVRRLTMQSILDLEYRVVRSTCRAELQNPVRRQSIRWNECKSYPDSHRNDDFISLAHQAAGDEATLNRLAVQQYLFHTFLVSTVVLDHNIEVVTSESPRDSNLPPV